MKKLLSMVLVFALVMAFCATGVSVMAEEATDVTLLVNDSEVGTKYTFSEGAKITWDAADKKVGDKSAVLSGAGKTSTITMNLSEVISTGVNNTGSFWFYFEDVSVIKELYWELASSGKCEGACVRYLIKKGEFGATLKTGWNKIDFKIHPDSDLNKTFDNYKFYQNTAMNESVDWTKVNYIRFVMQSNSESNTYKVNGFNLQTGEGTPAGDEEDTVAPSTQLLVDEAKEKTFVSASADVSKWNATDKKEGNQSFEFALPAKSGPQTVTYKAEGEVIVSAEQDWNAYYWLYIEDPESIKDFYWEISSSNNCANNCVRYMVTANYGLKWTKGWNKVSFKLHDSTALGTNANDDTAKAFSKDYAYYLGGNMNGNVDWAKINYIRFVFTPKNAEQTGKIIRINSLSFSKAATPNTNKDKVDAGDATNVTVIALATLASALVAGAVYFSIKKRTER